MARDHRSGLRARATRLSRAAFAAVVAGEPTIGGRYSALSPFGLVPAALIGVDLERFLLAGCEMADACRSATRTTPGSSSVSRLATAGREGRDKVCIPYGNGFGLWVEQLIAESTGKQRQGARARSG